VLFLIGMRFNQPWKVHQWLPVVRSMGRMQKHHMNPAEAVQAHQDLQAKRSVAVHWGTFALTDEALDQPPKELALARADKGLNDTDFALFKIGETRTVPARSAPLIALSMPGQLSATATSSAP
jgi:L-ascorbate metabolism protein UlaG (beta-lactamase superfamily)